MTYCTKGRSVLDLPWTKASGVIYFSLLSDYEYWVFSEVALWNCCDPLLPYSGMRRQKTAMSVVWHSIRKEVLWVIKFSVSLYEQYFQYELGKHCMSWNCTCPRMIEYELVFYCFMPAWFLQFNQEKHVKKRKNVGLSVSSIRIFLSQCLCLQRLISLNKAKWMSLTANENASCDINAFWLDGTLEPPSSVTGLTDVQIMMKLGKECGNKHWLYYNGNGQCHFTFLVLGAQMSSV